MKRRTFLQSTLAAGCLPVSLGASITSAAEGQSPRQFLLWRRYAIADEAQQTRVSDFLRTAALPALQRLNIGPVGVFLELDSAAGPSIYTLTPFDSLTDWLGLTDRLTADEQFMSAADDYLMTTPDAPAFERIDSQLMIAFTGYPRVQTPRRGERIFELRTYESYSEVKAKRKIEMFNEGGELRIFENVGLNGVFYGETLVGSNLPNLTYMLAYRDLDEHARAWQAFRSDPQWVELRDQERYRDTVSKINTQFLRPAEYSQI
jgi:hypothetical protein